MNALPDVVGVKEIAERLGVEPQVVRLWKHRGLLPEPDWSVGGRPAWLWSRFDGWQLPGSRVVVIEQAPADAVAS